MSVQLWSPGATTYMSKSKVFFLNLAKMASSSMYVNARDWPFKEIELNSACMEIGLSKLCWVRLLSVYVMIGPVCADLGICLTARLACHHSLIMLCFNCCGCNAIELYNLFQSERWLVSFVTNCSAWAQAPYVYEQEAISKGEAVPWNSPYQLKSPSRQYQY